MAISGQESINVGVVNQATGADDLYTAFNKVQNNFTTLFETSSAYNTFAPGPGMGVAANSAAGTVTFTNNGVLSLTPGTGIALSGGNGNVTISVSGTGLGNINVGVTNVGVSSNTLSVSNSPIISNGLINVELPVTANNDSFTAGEYVAPTLTVDQYGRISRIANTTSVGTVSSVAVSAVGAGLAISGGPITDTGTISIENTGVTRIKAGSGIAVSSTTGDITISSTTQNMGTVSRLDVASNTLSVSGSPVITSGTINIEIPSTFTITGRITAANVVSTGPIYAGGNASVTGKVTAGNIISLGNLTVTESVVSANATLGNLASANYFSGNLITAAQPNITSLGTLTTLSVTGNVSFASSLVATGNLGAGNITTAGTVTASGNLTAGNITTGGRVAASGNISTTSNMTVSGNITANTNITGGNILSGGAGILLGNLQAGNLNTGGVVYSTGGVYAPFVVLNTAPPVGTASGLFALDAANNRMGAYYSGAWHWATLSS